MAQKIRRGDTVLVAKGRDRGKQGRVQRVIPVKGRLVVEGVNMVTRHMRPTQGLRQAGRIRMEAPFSIANVALVCPQCSRPARIGFTSLEDGKKVRICRKCHETIE